MVITNTTFQGLHKAFVINMVKVRLETQGLDVEGKCLAYRPQSTEREYRQWLTCIAFATGQR